MNARRVPETQCCHGYCPDCGKEHALPSGNAEVHCRELMETLARKKRIDFTCGEHEADIRFATDPLFAPAGGKMFGVMECQTRHGKIVFHKAFSGQYNGQWHLEGWVPPVFDVQTFHFLTHDTEKEVKRLGRIIDRLDGQSMERNHLIRERKTLSQQLMQDIHALYEFRNFQAEKRSLSAVFGGRAPTGTGDCCAPKLLQYATMHDLIPLSLAEFYWGGENLSATRKHGNFYSSCQEKCQPILGFMLCGL